jgi:tetratricopeptide (TPR) repeat protein
MGSHADRALVLIRQGRYDMAEESLGLELAAAPDDPLPHALLALCRSERKQHASAVEEAMIAVAGGPDDAYYHFILARVLHAADRNAEAMRSIEEAIRIDPDEADHFHLLGALRYEKKDWKGALEAVGEGLSKDPENVSCANLRAMALVQLGESDAARDTLDSALEREPENALTHANKGWALIQERKYRESMESFREALRLDPTLDWAREGIVTALKARNVIYGAILRYYLWMAKLSSRTQWMVLIGGVLLVRFLRTAQRENPAIAPYTKPIIWAYFAFFILSWIADPLFNLLLRLHPFGKHALSRKEVMASNCVGGLLLAALVFFCIALGSG